MAIKAMARKNRNRAFRAALEFAGMTAGEFAEKQGVRSNHLSLVLSGKRISPRMDAEIAAFILKFREKVCNEPLVTALDELAA